MTISPRLNDYFFDYDICTVVIYDRNELSDGNGTLTTELVEWINTNTQNTKWTYRRTFVELDLKLVFKFQTEQEAIHFKMRWQ